MRSQENVNKLGLSQANHNEELTCKWKTKQKKKIKTTKNNAVRGEMTFWVTQLVNGRPRNTQPKSETIVWGKIDKACQSIVLFIRLFVMFKKDRR